MKKVLFYLLLLVLAPIAVLIIITPMDSQKQYIFGFISLAIMFVLGKVRISRSFLPKLTR